MPAHDKHKQKAHRNNITSIFSLIHNVLKKEKHFFSDLIDRILRRKNQLMEFAQVERTENLVVKGENAAYKHFLHFLQCFQGH